MSLFTFFSFSFSLVESFNLDQQSSSLCPYFLHFQHVLLNLPTKKLKLESFLGFFFAYSSFQPSCSMSFVVMRYLLSDFQSLIASHMSFLARVISPLYSSGAQFRTWCTMSADIFDSFASCIFFLVSWRCRNQILGQMCQSSMYSENLVINLRRSSPPFTLYVCFIPLSIGHELCC